MRKITVLIVGIMLAVSGLLAAPSAQADATDVQPTSPENPVVSADSGTYSSPFDSNAAFTRVQWSLNKGFTGCDANGNKCRWISVKCHFGNYWHILRRGESSIDACGGTGWIERTWGDRDVFIVVKNDQTGVTHVYPPGNNGIGGGYYHLWLQPVCPPGACD